MHALLNYGFVVALIVTTLGFAHAFYKTKKQSEVEESAHRHRAELAEQAKAGDKEHAKGKSSYVPIGNYNFSAERKDNPCEFTEGEKVRS